MGKPRLIILIRHAQSEGNKNREIHQTVPDHRVKLTPEGWQQVLPIFEHQVRKPTDLIQAEAAGLKLRSLLDPNDTLHFFTSPYRRTRETTEGILNTLTSPHPDPTPFPRKTIKVYEEPRLREQDFGNFQPSSAEMSRMWQERADYGHFFYRIPNGESAADAYDRVSGFNESLWRSFGEDDFASVCVLVTHGLMTRVFLMKWYHFSVEYFEDLRNINHCEFVVMRLNSETGKYVLQNQLRTWSELKREKANNRQEPDSPVPVRKKWGAHQDGESGDDFKRRQLARRQNTADLFDDDPWDGEAHAATKASSKPRPKATSTDEKKDTPLSKDTPSRETDAANTHVSQGTPHQRARSPHRLEILTGGRDGGGSRSGTTSPNRSGSEDSDADVKEYLKRLPLRSSLAMALHGEFDGDGGAGKDRIRADALGDQSDVEDEADAEVVERLERREKSFEGAVL